MLKLTMSLQLSPKKHIFQQEVPVPPQAPCIVAYELLQGYSSSSITDLVL